MDEVYYWVSHCWGIAWAWRLRRTVRVALRRAEQLNFPPMTTEKTCLRAGRLARWARKLVAEAEEAPND